MFVKLHHSNMWFKKKIYNVCALICCCFLLSYGSLVYPADHFSIKKEENWICLSAALHISNDSSLILIQQWFLLILFCLSSSTAAARCLQEWHLLKKENNLEKAARRVKDYKRERERERGRQTEVVNCAGLEWMEDATFSFSIFICLFSPSTTI